MQESVPELPVLLATLHHIPFLSHLSDDDLIQVSRNGQMVMYDAGQIVVREGDAAEGMYVIVSGQVRVYKNEQGQQIEIAVLSQDEFFGELALLDEGTRSATVECITPCVLFVLDRAAFIRLLADADSQVIYRLFAVLTRRIRDTSERFFREELAKQRLEAEMQIERHRSLAQMVAGVAHEINTPLGIVNTAASIIQNRVRSGRLVELAADDRHARTMLEDMQEASELIQGNITRAHRLVQDFKKISVNQLTDTKEVVDLAELITSVLDLFKINARHSKLNIVIKDDLPAGHKIWQGYPASFSQVLMNLLTNAERYAYPDGTGGDVWIEVKDEPERDRVILTLRDFGQGIAAEHLPHVFDPFFTTGRGQGGTGLGLSIVYNIVRSILHGEIHIESHLNQGTTITVLFPRDVPERVST